MMFQSSAAVPAEDEAGNLKAQLFRYAQDMGDLMQQHKRLERQHRMVLQSLGRDVLADDLLANVLAQTWPLYWVSTAAGNLLRASPSAGAELDAQGVAVPGSNMAQLLQAEQRPLLQAALARFEAGGSRAAGLQWQLHMAALPGAPPPQRYDALALQVPRNGHFEIYWILRHAADDGQTALPLQLQSELVSTCDSEHGLMLTSPFGGITAVNAACCRITGYSPPEMLGNNPRMFSSGRHDSSFYQEFWLEMLEKSSWRGTLFNRRKGGHIFLEWQAITMVEDIHGEVLSYISAKVDLSYTDPASQRLQTMAYSDPLTGLPNRRMLMDRLGKLIDTATANGPELAVLFIDLNRFKPINDELGHEMGDKVLQEVARRMGSVLQADDLLARVGGDEFVILLCGFTRTSQMEAIAQTLHQALMPVMYIGAHPLTIGASMGCAHYPQDAQDMGELLKHADAAMYAAKRYAIPFCAYRPDLEHRDEVNLEFDLWQALERHEISLVYQPQIRSQEGGTLRGCEALMRWKHPVAGDVEPTVFIALAEKSGAIVPLGNWALAQACEQLRQWRAEGMTEMTLSLNVSLRQLRDPAFLPLVEHTLQDKELPPYLLEMELSETQTVLFSEQDTRPIRALRQLGVRIAIDDFGISFNSLARLNTLSISSLKINAQCVQDMPSSADARAISNCMIAIGQAMGIEVIAQGVETRAQADLLEQQGCRVIQGFYAGHPVPAATLAPLVKVG